MVKFKARVALRRSFARGFVGLGLVATLTAAVPAKAAAIVLQSSSGAIGPGVSNLSLGGLVTNNPGVNRYKVYFSGINVAQVTVNFNVLINRYYFTEEQAASGVFDDGNSVGADTEDLYGYYGLTERRTKNALQYDFTIPLLDRFVDTRSSHGYITYAFVLENGVSARIQPALGAGMSASYRIEQLAVPEPQTWAMMIFGFAVIGVALRRRNSLGPSYF